ncbi:MAG: DUF2158 domain-containing protein [Chitinophagaceae bacterium]|nr:DUF2158 domain-containing protein [Chitinophagaceae bacterium]
MANEKPIPPAFKVGDTVKLKSGGPLMTVKILKNQSLYIDEKGEPNFGFIGFIVCNWFDSITSELKSEILTQEMLMTCANTGEVENNLPVVINKHI